MDDHNYPQTDLTENQKRRHAEIMVAGNTVLADAYEQVEDKRQLHTQNRIRFCNHILEQGAGEVEGVEITKEDFDKIKAVKGLEDELIAGYSKMVFSVVGSWTKNHNSDDDFVQEGMLALVRASVYFLGEPANFATFLWHSIKHRLIVAYRKDRIMPVPAEANKLRLRYSKAKQSFNGPATFDEIIESMNMSDIEQRLLLDSQLAGSVYESSSVRVSGKEEHPHSWVETTQELAGINGYSFQSSGQHNNHTLLKRHEGYNNSELANAIATVTEELDEWHRAVLEAFVEDEYGWRERISKEHVNPVTKTRYSRAAANLALQRIFKRLRAVYSGERRFLELLEELSEAV